ncbi:MAG TPA: hypothetical protein VJM74_06630 [Nitrososphaeraceae archaeon]|jgi:hypothetical protein|nr:hypothetical protein [Nitrososphaeraceae archaeon]
MEKYYCNICQRSIEARSLENHVIESGHISRRKKLEVQLKDNGQISSTNRSVIGFWKKD